MLKIKIKLESLLYNNDKEALDYLKKIDNKNININNYVQEPKKEIVNEIELEVREDYSIDYLLKKLSKKLMDKIDIQENNENIKTCVYCFADRDLKNIENENQIIIMDQNIKISKIKTQQEIDDIDIDEEDMSEIEFDDDFDESDLSSINIDELSDDEELYGAGMGGSKNGNKIFICNNCKKIYFFKKYFDWKNYKGEYKNYKGIFPFPELIYLRNKEKKLSFNLIDNQKKEIQYIYNDKSILSPYDNIIEINKQFLKKDKKNTLYKYLDSISLNDGKEYKYIYNTSFMLLKNFNYENLTMSYFPEMCLYKKNNQYNSIEIYSKLYYPNINFANYYLKFLDNIEKDKYVEITLRKIQLNKRKVNDDLNIYTIEQVMVEKYGKYQTEDDFYEGWGPDIENKEIIDQKFNELDDKDIIINKYINKINYKINNSKETNSLINFSLIFHLFELNEQTPFISSYLPEEGVMLEKYYRPLKEEIETLNLVVKNKKIIRFLTLLPEEIFGEKKYFYIHLYENLKVEVTIVISNKKKIYINKKELLLINNKVNKLIKKLNKLNIFNFSDIKIPLSNEKFENWNKNPKKTNINSINLNFEISNQKIDDIHNKINKLSKCFNNYFIRDFNYNINDFRYIKINNINLGVLTDRYIYFKIENIRELDTNNIKTDEEITDILIHNIMSDFQKNFFEAKNIYKNYLARYKHFDNQIVPINYGVFFNIKKDDEDNNDKYIINVFGLRDYDDIKNIENFIKKMFYILNNPNDKNVKEISKICIFINEKKENDLQILSKQNLILLNQKYRKCINQYNKAYYLKKNLKKNDKKQLEKYNNDMKKFKEIKEKIYKKIQKKEESTKHIKALKQLQNVFNNLKYNSCSDKNIKQYTKRCQAQKQPMGTGSGTYEEVIDFNKDYEENRFKKLDKIECSIENIQFGGTNEDLGSFSYLNYCNYWNSKYEYKDYQECYLEIIHYKAKGKKKIQKLASDVYEIDSEQKQIKVVLKDIHEKIKENLVNETNYEEYYKKIKNIEENGENLIDFLKEYYNNDLLQTYNLNNKENIHELSEYLFSKKFPSKYELFKNLINELNNKSEKKIIKGISMTKIISLIVQKFKLINLILYGTHKNYKHLSFIKKLIIYIIDKIFKIKDIKKNELQNIMIYLNNGKKNKIKLFNLIEYDIFIQQFYDTFLIFNSKNFYNDNIDNDIDEKKINETSLKQLRSEVKDLIIRTDPDTNEIINSTIQFKNKALTCPNYSENKDNVKIKPLIGFLDISKYSNKDNLPDNKIRDLVCQPCCFGQKYNKKEDDHIIDKRYRKNMLFCKNKISWKNYLKLIENETRIDGYIYSEALNINTTFGMLCKPLYNLFNNFIFLLNDRKKLNYENFLFKEYNNSNRVLKKYGFCKKGYDQKKNVILSILEDILNLKKNIIINKIKKKLDDNPEIFKILNEGKLNILFKNINNYINYLNSDNVDINWIVDILKYPGIFENYNNGINIILFKKINEDDEDSDINIVKYNFIDMIDYFDSDKNIIFLYKHFSGELEPIFLKKNKLQLGIFNKKISHRDILKNIDKTYNIDINNYFGNFIDFFKNWINIIFKNNYFSAKKLIKKFEIKKQLIDKFYKVNYLIDINDNLIPVLPSEIDINYDFEIFNDFEFFEKNNYLKNFENTKIFMNNIKIKLKDENYLYEKMILDDNKKNIVGIELRNNLIIPIIPSKYNKLEYDIISSKFLYYNINNILFDNEKIKEEIRFVKEKYDLEIYQRFILEFSNYLNNNRNDKLTLNQIINTDKKLFSDHIFSIVDKIISFKENKLIHYEKINTQKNNQRIICNIDQNFYCDKNKLIIPFSKKNFLIGLFIESLINNEDFRLKIFNNKMNNIIDINKYIDDKKHIYKKKDFIF